MKICEEETVYIKNININLKNFKNWEKFKLIEKNQKPYV